MSIKAEICLDNRKYDIIKLIGVGSYGKVYETICRNTERKCALKIISKISTNCENESIIMRYLASCYPNSLFYPNIYQTAIIDSGYHIAMELFTDYLSIETLCKLGQQMQYYRKNVIFSIFASVNNMHNTKIAHLDLSPANILLPYVKNSNNIKHIVRRDEVKIIDYGSSLVINEGCDNLGIFEHCMNMTTTIVISPLVGLLYQKTMLSPSQHVNLDISTIDRINFYHISDLWAVFHISCLFLNKCNFCFAASPELLDYLGVKKVWNKYNMPISSYMIFMRNLFFQDEECLKLFDLFLQNCDYFIEQDTEFLKNIFDILQSYNVGTYKNIDHKCIINKILKTCSHYGLV